MQTYGYLAILFGSLAAFCFAIKAIFVRLSESKYHYHVWDLAIDYQILQHIIMTVAFVWYCSSVEVTGNEYFHGAVSSVLFLVGSQLCQLAYAAGPGGPVNSIICTQTIYQITLSRFIYH